jgi:hypothetical protein
LFAGLLVRALGLVGGFSGRAIEAALGAANLSIDFSICSSASSKRFSSSPFGRPITV